MASPDPVEFSIELKSGADGYSVKKDLEGLAQDMTVMVMEYKRLKTQLLLGITSQGTYERVFDAELTYITRTINNINRGPYDVQEWNETKPATVPAGLDDMVESITLAPRVYLTD